VTVGLRRSSCFDSSQLCSSLAGVLANSKSARDPNRWASIDDPLGVGLSASLQGKNREDTYRHLAYLQDFES
jgi:hypothetical protein